MSANVVMRYWARRARLLQERADAKMVELAEIALMEAEPTSVADLRIQAEFVRSTEEDGGFSGWAVDRLLDRIAGMA